MSDFLAVLPGPDDETDEDKFNRLERLTDKAYNNIEHDYYLIMDALDSDEYKKAFLAADQIRNAIEVVRDARKIMDTLDLDFMGV